MKQIEKKLIEFGSILHYATIFCITLIWIELVCTLLGIK